MATKARWLLRNGREPSVNVGDGLSLLVLSASKPAPVEDARKGAQSNRGGGIQPRGCIEAPARRKRRPPEERRPARPQRYVAAMMTGSTPGQPVGNPGGLAHSVAVLLEVVDREVLALRRVRKASVAELLHDWHELVLGEALECLSGLPEVDHAPPSVDRAG